MVTDSHGGFSYRMGNMSSFLNLAEHSRYADLDGSARDVAEVLAEFDRDLYIKKLEPNHPYYNPPYVYALLHHPVGMEQYVIRQLMPSQIDARLIADVIESVAPVEAGMDAMEAHNKAIEILETKKRQEEREARIEFMADIARINDTRHYAKHNGQFLNPRNRW